MFKNIHQFEIDLFVRGKSDAESFSSPTRLERNVLSRNFNVDRKSPQTYPLWKSIKYPFGYRKSEFPIRDITAFIDRL